MCPQCKSANLDIATMKGVERLLIFLTDKRKYRCRDCQCGFRAPDRRRTRREGDAIAAARAAGILR
jgi:transposase-like protein